jgi:hypothetical protein
LVVFDSFLGKPTILIRELSVKSSELSVIGLITIKSESASNDLRCNFPLLRRRKMFK